MAALVQASEKQKELETAKRWYQERTQPDYGIVSGHDPDKLEEAGWGVVFPAQVNPEIEKALEPLLEWRKEKATQEDERYYRRMVYFRDDEKNQWLADNGYGPGPAKPEKIPYYLLLVGSPEEIPYSFQTSLDVQYAVGRICFDTVEEYANYANSVVEAERKFEEKQFALPRQLGFFAVCNDDDPATRTSAQFLIDPLMKTLVENPLKKQAPWAMQYIPPAEAKKAKLGEMLGGPLTPGLLFTASHGMKLPFPMSSDPKEQRKLQELQERRQGALITGDFPGPKAWKAMNTTGAPLKEDFYFSAEDLSADASLWGTLAFFFACFGGGTPQIDEFGHRQMQASARIAQRSFTAKLPQRMLSHPKGGALAVAGHVDRAWGYSFLWDKQVTIGVFESVIKALMSGSPIGYAFEQLNVRYGELASDLTGKLKWVVNNLGFDEHEVSSLFTAHNDAKNYAILGDPAVRLMVAPEAPQEEIERPAITLTSIKPVAEMSFTTAGGETESGVVDPAGSALATAGGGSQGEIVPPDGEIDYTLAETVQEFGKKLGMMISMAVDSASKLSVRTYTSDSMVAMGSNKPQDARLRAMTIVSLLGDVEQIVPIREDQVDLELWNIHLEMVRQAQQARGEMLKAIINAANSLVNLKG
jgi:hypothetical protein